MFRRKHAAKSTGRSPRCSFCGKVQSEVDKLVAGPGVYICNECVGFCDEIIREEVEEDQTPSK